MIAIAWCIACFEGWASCGRTDFPEAFAHCSTFKRCSLHIAGASSSSSTLLVCPILARHAREKNEGTNRVQCVMSFTNALTIFCPQKSRAELGWRLNHSCSPNCQQSWDENSGDLACRKTVEKSVCSLAVCIETPEDHSWLMAGQEKLYAMTKIQPGEELCVSARFILRIHPQNLTRFLLAEHSMRSGHISIKL